MSLPPLAQLRHGERDRLRDVPAHEGPRRPAEGLSHLRPASFAVAERSDGEAVGVVGIGGGHDIQARLAEVWPLIHACRPDAVLHCGVSAPVAEAAGLPAAVTQARYARAAARVASPRSGRVMAVDELFGLDTLLAGVPADVKDVYRTRVLGPLLPGEGSSNAMLLETLEVFLAHDGSWARTAKALHLHVNTVHYRIERIEALTGRDLSRLDHRLDLRTALLCG
ncbi:helix-turn-helix domain-containing protein [Streptomyces sp. NPDC046324]|uniref:PucR family transcriptional regulator n=1 Tax=Streptomyces sp. NPDC046324 TaxID=3154915 RepID=UPI00340E2D7C